MCLDIMPNIIAHRDAMKLNTLYDMHMAMVAYVKKYEL